MKKDYLKLPKSIKRRFIGIIIINTIYTLLRQLSGFLLTGATLVFEQNVILSFVLLVAFLLKDPVYEAMKLIGDQNEALAQQNLKEFLAAVKTKIIAKTRDKVENDERKMMSPAVILNTVEEYLSTRYFLYLRIILFSIETVVFVISFVEIIKIAASKTNNLPLFILILVLVTIINICLSLVISKSRDKIWKKAKKAVDEEKNSERDVQEIEPICFKHVEFMLESLVEARKRITDIAVSDVRKKNIEEFVKSVIIAISIITVELVMLLSSSEGITVSLFMTTIAFGQVFSSVVSQISKEIAQAYMIINMRKENKTKFEKDFQRIMNVYLKEKEKEQKSVSGDILKIQPFSYTYSATGFCISMPEELFLKKGEIVLLKGQSGAGKSTFVKLVLGELFSSAIEGKIKNIKYFNDTSMLGGKDLLSEITLEHDTIRIDKKKLMEILQGCRLIDKFPNIDSLKTQVAKELSNGLMQRALLARSLYNLGDSDLVCIDEPIGALDEETAKRVVVFIKDYCNKDKKRFIILCTHQYKLVDEYIDRVVLVKKISEKESEVMFD